MAVWHFWLLRVDKDHSFTGRCRIQCPEHLLLHRPRLLDVVESQPPGLLLARHIRHDLGRQLLGPLNNHNPRIIALPTVVRTGEHSHHIACLTNATKHWLVASYDYAEAVFDAEFIGTVLAEFDSLC